MNRKKHGERMGFDFLVIENDTLEKMKEKLEGKEICFPLMQIGKNWVAEFVDSEGNHIEVYTAVSQ